VAKVTLRVFASLATALGKKETEVEGSSLKEVLDSLIKEHGEEFRARILNGAGNPQRHIRIYINGKDIRFLKQLDTSLSDGDEVLILPAVVGG
jgi:molybdopterin synthase sulfur carrier subunit